jgi:hypothetical protein
MVLVMDVPPGIERQKAEQARIMADDHVHEVPPMNIAVTSLVQDREAMEVKKGKQNLADPVRPSSLDPENHPHSRSGKNRIEQEHANGDSGPVREGQLISPNQVL